MWRKRLIFKPTLYLGPFVDLLTNLIMRHQCQVITLVTLTIWWCVIAGLHGFCEPDPPLQLSLRKQQLRDIRRIVCPQPGIFGCFSRVEGEGGCVAKSARCTTDCNCGQDQLCCRNECGVHICSKPVSTVPKSGECPELFTPECLSHMIADFAFCRFDNECTSDKKCCVNGNPACGGERLCQSPLLQPPPVVIIEPEPDVEIQPPEEESLPLPQPPLVMVDPVPDVELPPPEEGSLVVPTGDSLVVELPPQTDFLVPPQGEEEIVVVEDIPLVMGL